MSELNKIIINDEERLSMISKVSDKFKEIIDILKISRLIETDHIHETPDRIARMFVNELFAGCYNDPPKITSFPVVQQPTGVLVSGISVKSLCAHHFVPFTGEAVVYYLPKDKLCGLSKLSRTVEYFSRRPQIQEILTDQVGRFLVDKLQPRFLVVMVRAKHLCMTHRGAGEHDSVTDTVYTYTDDAMPIPESLMNHLYNQLPPRSSVR